MLSGSHLSGMLTALDGVTSGVHTPSQNLTDQLAPRIFDGRPTGGSDEASIAQAERHRL